LIPVGFGYGDGDEFFLRGWVWDSETHPRLAPLPSLLKRVKENTKLKTKLQEILKTQNKKIKIRK